MLTVLTYLVPNLKDIHYSILVEYCVANTKYYCKMKDKDNALYWSKRGAEYLIKRFGVKKKGR